MSSSEYRWSAVRTVLLTAWALGTLVLLFVVVLLIREIALSGRDPMGAFQANETANEAGQAPQPTRTASLGIRDIQLYFAAPDGRTLVPEKRDLAITESTASNCKTALGALIEGPRGSGLPLLAADVTINSLFLREDGELVINFSRALQAGHSRASSAAVETLLVQGVVQTLTQSALQNPREPQVRRVRFLIAEELPTEAFPAHIDLSEPVTPDARWLTAQY